MNARTPRSVLAHSQNRRPQPPRLLRGLQQNLVPTRTPFARGRQQSFVATSRRQQNNFRNAQLGCFLQAPFQAVEFHYRHQKLDLQRRLLLLN